jgi:hypothetical protein
MWGLQFLRTSWAGFRLVSSLLKKLVTHEKIERAPEPETLIQWELKIGLYKLERPKPSDEEWIWMADHVIRLGSYKCFVVVGARMAALRAKGNLTVALEDLEPIAIIPMRMSNGIEVAKELKAAINKVGAPPACLVIDHGSDLYAGSKLVVEDHPGMYLKYDVCHKVACELKRRLNTDVWMEMTTGAAEVKKALSLGPFAKYAPPQQRSKARYMNLDTLVNWGYNVIQQYEELPAQVREKTAWLSPLKQDIRLWREWLQIGQVTRDTIRTEGFYEGVEDLLIDRIIELKLSEASEDFTKALVDYVSSESAGIAYNGRMIGSTEALEGLFGGYKRMAGENKMSVNGLGRLILCMSSRIGVFSEEVVYEAMTKIKCRDVRNWLDQAFGIDRSFLEENREQCSEEIACNF